MNISINKNILVELIWTYADESDAKYLKVLDAANIDYSGKTIDEEFIDKFYCHLHDMNAQELNDIVFALVHPYAKDDREWKQRILEAA